MDYPDEDFFDNSGTLRPSSPVNGESSSEVTADYTSP